MFNRVPSEYCNLVNFILYCRYQNMSPIKSIIKELQIIANLENKNLIRKELKSISIGVELLLIRQPNTEQEKFLKFVYNLKEQDKKKIINIIINNISI